MLRYKQKELTKRENKLGGKNQIKGFYEDNEGNVFFVKKPSDPLELFTELLAGLLINEFKCRQLIPAHYHDSLITADWLQFEDKSYGLIQPKINFIELYKEIGTGYSDNSDRNPLLEIISGPHYYSLIATQIESYYGLSMVLMFSLLLGDYSVHSGNVVCIPQQLGIDKKTIIQFARIDWGAAFRYFGYYKDLLKPFEYQGWFNYRLYTKGYIFNYKKIKGLFPAIAKHAGSLLITINEEIINNIVANAFKQIPADLVSKPIKDQLSEYLGLPSLKEASFGESGNYQQFAIDFSKIIFKRLKAIAKLNDFEVESNCLYKSMVFESMNSEIKLNLQPLATYSKIIKKTHSDLDEDNTAIAKLIGKLHNKLLSDPVIMDVLAETKMAYFMPIVIKDLLILKKFHDKKIKLVVEKIDKNYQHSINLFYKEAIQIRLSENTKAEQAHSLLKLAYKYFGARQQADLIWQEISKIYGKLFHGEKLAIDFNSEIKKRWLFFRSTQVDRNALNIPVNWLCFYEHTMI